jgi:SAM-dependent methyltransferase
VKDLKNSYYPESRFGGFSDVDGTILFYTRLNAMIEPGFTILDYGCGRGAFGDDPISYRRNLRILKGKVRRVIGVDVDGEGVTNPFIDEFQAISGDRWPLDDDTIDLCVCDSVMEHLERPPEFFKEAHRVIKDKGYLCIRTTNSWGYPAWFARLIPNKLHARILGKVKDKVKEQEVFPTYYRCNTISVLKRYLEKQRFVSVVYGFGTEPSYLSFSKLAYWFGLMHQRYSLRALQLVIFGFAQNHK